MKKVMILIENLFDEQELIYPYHRLREDFEVVLVGSKKDEAYTSTLSQAGLLTVDARVRERRMVGTGGKARRKKQSPKR